MTSVDLVLLLCCCIRGCLVAQRYIAHDLLRVQDLLQPGPDTVQVGSFILDLRDDQRQRLLSALTSAIDVTVKAELAHKTGSATQDLVTTADVLTQEVLVRMLHRTFPDLPFTIIGEEEIAPSAALQARAEECLRKYNCDDDDSVDCDAAQEADDAHIDAACLAVPYEQQLRDHVASQPPPSPSNGAASKSSPQGAADGMVWAADLQTLRERVVLYIDPIDGTSCFVEGQWQVPMSLVGITVDGVPVAGVTNRVFRYPVISAPGRRGAQEHKTSCTCGLSYVWNAVSCPQSAPCPFIVYDGQHIFLPSSPPPPTQQCATTFGVKTASLVGAITAKEGALHDGQDGKTDNVSTKMVMRARVRQPVDVLLVTYSSTTREQTLQHVLKKLRPVRSCLARGAGNKLLRVVSQALQDCGASISSDNTANGNERTTDKTERDGTWAGADVFLSPGEALCRWDCCAAQAFLIALGGQIYDFAGCALRYDVATSNRHSLGADNILLTAITTHNTEHKGVKEQTVQGMDSQSDVMRCTIATCTPCHPAAKLSNGVLAVTATAKAEVRRRMQW